jgi:glucose/arabinose dehydrogenase
MTITAPAALATNLPNTIAFSAAPNAGTTVGIAEFQVDGGAAGTAAGPPFSVTVDTTAFAPGQHVLRVRGGDGAGNFTAWTSILVQASGSRTVPAGFTSNESFVGGLTLATAFAALPDGRLLVAEQAGDLLVLNGDGTPIGTMLSVPAVLGEERGLLGVAVHPDFAHNGYIYIYYTTSDSPSPHNRISRFTVSGDTAGSEEQLINLPQLTQVFHNGGSLHFGTDGKLYVGVGDNQQSDLAQDLSSPLGKLLRFNDDGSIPGDNPFCATNGNLACAVWAYGLRNPFNFAVQQATGRIFINDVGENTWEEIDVGARGANYGWPTSEGPDNLGPGMTGPLFTYNHNPASPPGSGAGGFFIGDVITGGAFYPETGMFPAPWRGGYFFADYEAKFIGYLDLHNANAAYSFGSVSGSPVGLLVAADGALLVLTQDGITRISTP